MLRPETETSIPFPAKKRAGKSEFSLNNSTTSDNEYSVNGPESAIPELPFQGGFIALYRQYFNALTRRAPGIQLPIAIYIIGQTDSAARRPEYAKIPIKEFIMLTGASERMNWVALARLEENGLLKRDGHGGLKVCLDGIGNASVRAVRTRKSKAKEAAVHAPSSIAALQLDSVKPEIYEAQETERQLPQRATGENQRGYSSELSTDDGSGRAVGYGDANCGESRDGRTEGGDCGGDSGRSVDGRTREMDFCVPGATVQSGKDGSADARLQPVAVNGATDFRNAATYCPWNWTCPHLSTASPLVSIETRNIEEPTTTGAVDVRHNRPLSAELENAYLARFLAPVSRVAEFLKIDERLAGDMWAASVAVNPALTPREFVSIANMKLAEWRRIDDRRPGLKIKGTITGLLKASMPNAVAGALYMLAHEQAPAELARDCRDARDVLIAEPAAAPRDRAWARAVLAEAGERERGET